MSVGKSFFKNVAMLMTGTTIAQAIPVLVSPLLTRIYSPEDFGAFALYLAIASIVAVVVTGRYEMAILLPKKESDAYHLVVLSVLLAAVASLCLFFAIVSFKPDIEASLGWSGNNYWIYWLPLSVFFTAAYQSLNYMCNREGRYKQMALSRIFQSSSMTSVHLVVGYLKVGGAGLIAGQIIGQVSAAGVMTYMMFIKVRRTTLRIHKRKMFALIKRYSDFPKYLILAHGFNTASAQSPVIFLSAMFGSGSAGFYILIQRVIGAPMVIVAGAIGDVFRHEASQEYAKSGNCRLIYRSSFFRLLIISVVPFSIFLLFAPELFVLVFGEAWRLSGEYAQILTPMFFLQFLTSPLSTMFMIAQKQKIDLVWQTVLFGLVLAAFLIGNHYDDIEVALAFVSFFYSCMYAINGIVSYSLACGKWR